MKSTFTKCNYLLDNLTDQLETIEDYMAHQNHQHYQTPAAAAAIANPTLVKLQQPQHANQPMVVQQQQPFTQQQQMSQQQQPQQQSQPELQQQQPQLELQQLMYMCSSYSSFEHGPHWVVGCCLLVVGVVV